MMVVGVREREDFMRSRKKCERRRVRQNVDLAATYERDKC